MQIKKFETVMKTVELIPGNQGDKITDVQKPNVFDELKLSLGKLNFQIKLTGFVCVNHVNEKVWPTDVFIREPRHYPQSGNIYLLYDVTVTTNSRIIYSDKLYSGYCAILNAGVYNNPNTKKYHNNDYWFNFRLADKYNDNQSGSEAGVIYLLLKHFLHLAWMNDYVIGSGDKIKCASIGHFISVLMKEYALMTSTNGENVSIIIPASVTDNNTGITMKVTAKGRQSENNHNLKWATAKISPDWPYENSNTGDIVHVSYKVYGNLWMKDWFEYKGLDKHSKNFDIKDKLSILSAYLHKTISMVEPKAFINPVDLTTLFKDV